MFLQNRTNQIAGDIDQISEYLAKISTGNNAIGISISLAAFTL